MEKDIELKLKKIITIFKKHYLKENNVNVKLKINAKYDEPFNPLYSLEINNHYYYTIFNLFLGESPLDVFTKFLIKYKCYSSFKKNLRNHFINDKYKTIDVLCKKINITDYIDSAFIWDESKEGFSFWDDLNDYWRDYINEYNEKLFHIIN